jgi:tRNA A37 N6-isopentenylltransferase MiaA
MAPIGEEEASIVVVLEMLRGINDQLESQNAAATSDREVLHDIAVRVDRIERNQLERKVKELADKVDSLESERDQRRGITQAAEWIAKFGPSIILLIAAIVGWVAYARTH